jgi:hypothetical protein
LSILNDMCIVLYGAGRGVGQGFPLIVLVATRSIKKGDELLWDYGKKYLLREHRVQSKNGSILHSVGREIELTRVSNPFAYPPIFAEPTQTSA